MLTMLCFVCAVISIIVCACCFIVPPLWLNGANQHVCVRTRAIYTGLLVLLLVTVSLSLDYTIGNYNSLQLSQNAEYLATQQNTKLIRPLYANLQRDLVKYDLNIPIDIKNVDLILTFAQAESEANNGPLPKDVQKLLLAVLQAVPNQVTALNLLAVHAYKNAQFAIAIGYWQAILQQFPEHLTKTELWTILQDKINHTKLKLANQRKAT